MLISINNDTYHQGIGPLLRAMLKGTLKLMLADYTIKIYVGRGHVCGVHGAIALSTQVELCCANLRGKHYTIAYATG